MSKCFSCGPFFDRYFPFFGPFLDYQKQGVRRADDLMALQRETKTGVSATISATPCQAVKGQVVFSRVGSKISTFEPLTAWHFRRLGFVPPPGS